MSLINKEEYQNILHKLGDKTKLMAVSKFHPVSKIKELYHLGQRDFGENKVQELYDKATELKELKDIRWHFIGNLQTNKINKLLSTPNLYSIHSIDRVTLLEKLLSKMLDQKINLYLQVNTSDESEKSGLESIEELETCIELLKGRSDFKLTGLMTIGKIRTDDFEASAHDCFQKLSLFQKTLNEKYDLDLELSMGMSSDYEIAATYGSNWVRIGSLIFGHRE